MKRRPLTEHDQKDFWPELMHPSMVDAARLAGAQATAMCASARARSLVEDASGSALGIPALNPDSFCLRRRPLGRSHG